VTDPIVGIDLGTSNSVVAYADTENNVRVMSDEAGYRIHPSVVSFHPNGGVVVGASAKQRKVIDPSNTIYSVKRLIGRAYASPEVQTAKSRVPYQIKEGANQLPMIVTRGGEFAVPEISAIVLDHVRNIAAAQLDSEVNRAVVTVPASFNDAQRSATATAGAIAGLTVVRVLNEPTAAALAYGSTRNLREIIAVYDFGGGTFDITILKLEDQVYEVLGTSGDTFLGGDDLDERIVDKMVDRFLADNRIDLRTNEVSMMRLRAVAEQTKIELSRRSRAVVRIDEIAYGPRGAPLNLQIEVTHDEFVSHVADLIDKTFPVCQEAMSLAGLAPDRINDVILVGGTTKIPYVRDQVTKFFAKTPRTDVNPEDAVAVGAALQATSLERILARPTRGSVKMPTLEEDTLSSFANPIGNDDITKKDPDHERAKRSTSGYDKRPPEQPRPTEYSLTRTQTIDRYEEREKPATRPPPMAIPVAPPSQQPLARMTKTGAQTPVVPTPIIPAAAIPPFPPTPSAPPPPLSPRTMFGVPAGPALAPTAPEPDDDPSSLTFDPADEPTDANTGVRVRPPSVERPATPPPIPTPLPFPAQPPPVPPRLPTSRIPAQSPNPATTQPLSPVVPVAAPTARTLAAIDLPAASSTARGMGKAALEIDLPPASTAKGFQPPQAYPVLPQTPVTFAPPVAPTPPVAFQAAPSPAAFQAGPPPAPPQMATVLEVTPRSLGIGTVAGFCEELIRRNSKVPTEIRKLFTTSRDSQDSVHIVVVQGESRRLDNNVVIGDLRLDNLPPRPRGETSIEVTFALDPSGILQVRARDAHTGLEQRAQLDVVGNVPAADVAGSRERIASLRR